MALQPIRQDVLFIVYRHFDPLWLLLQQGLKNPDMLGGRVQVLDVRTTVDDQHFVAYSLCVQGAATGSFISELHFYPLLSKGRIRLAQSFLQRTPP